MSPNVNAFVWNGKEKIQVEVLDVYFCNGEMMVSVSTLDGSTPWPADALSSRKSSRTTMKAADVFLEEEESEPEWFPVAVFISDAGIMVLERRIREY